MKHIIEECTASAELRQRRRVISNLKGDLGNEQLAADRTLSFLKAARILDRL